MVTSPDLSHLIAEQNKPWIFWHLLDSRIHLEDWMDAIRAAMSTLEGLPVLENRPDPSHMMADILSEAQFGPCHWHMSFPKRLYYQFVRPFLPDALRPFFRTLLLSRQRKGFALDWPIESRYACFQFELVRQILIRKGLEEVLFLHFWPYGKRFAFVLTHDVEAEEGQQFVPHLADLDEKYGFRSSFNFVPEKYKVDLRLIEELKGRGFEVGVHGLKHDGKLFLSKAIFDTRVKKINHYLKEWEAVGFRSPMTQRNPEWMQALEIEYDLSFFDTDPYEPIQGGTMSIWPFQMGRFIELPYTLPQDHTLMVTLGETTTRLWLEKVDFIEKNNGMALVNAHPDYLKDPSHFAIYEDFLQQMRARDGYWHALPRDVARWWKKRTEMDFNAVNDNLKTILPGGTIGVIRMCKNGKKLEIII